LREALSKDSESLAAGTLARPDHARQKIAAIKTSQAASVSAAYSSLAKIARSFEDQINLHEQRLHQHLSCAEELQAQIKGL
jgi:hypothetical protein